MNFKTLFSIFFLFACIINASTIQATGPSATQVCAATAATTGLIGLKTTWDLYSKNCILTGAKRTTTDFLKFTKHEIAKTNSFLKSPKNLTNVKALATQSKLLTSLITTTEVLASAVAIKGCINVGKKLKEHPSLMTMLATREKELASVEKELTTAKEELTAAQAEHQECATVRHRIEDEKDKAEQNVVQLKEELKLLNTELVAQQEKKKPSLSPEKTELNPSPEREKLEETIAALKRILGKTKTMLQENLETLEKQESEFKEKEQEFKDHEQELLTVLEANKEEYEESVQTIHQSALTAYNNLEDAYNTLQAVFDQQNKALRNTTINHDHLLRSTKEMILEINALKEQIATLTQQLETTTQELTTATQNKEITDEENIGLNYQILELRAQLEELKELEVQIIKQVVRLSKSKSNQRYNSASPQLRRETLSPLTPDQENRDPKYFQEYESPEVRQNLLPI